MWEKSLKFSLVKPLLLTLLSGFASIALASLDITKEGPVTVGAGGTLVYNIAVTNNADEAVTNATVTDVLPAHTQFLNARVLGISSDDTSGANWVVEFPTPLSSGNVTFTNASFQEGATTNFEITVQANSDLKIGDTLTNTVTASGSGITASTATLETAITVSNQARLCGNILEYTVAAVNPRDVALEGARLTVQLPENAAYISAQPESGVTIVSEPNVGEKGGVIVFEADLGANEQKQAIVRLQPEAGANEFDFQGITRAELDVTIPGGSIIFTSIAPFSLEFHASAVSGGSSLVNKIISKYCCLVKTNGNGNGNGNGM